MNFLSMLSLVWIKTFLAPSASHPLNIENYSRKKILDSVKFLILFPGLDLKIYGAQESTVC